MHRSQLLLALTVLLSLYSSVYPSNPDSEVVQDTSEESEGSQSKSAQFRSTSDQRRDRGPPIPGVRLFRPFLTGSRVVWREVGVSRPFFKEMARETGVPKGIERINGMAPFSGVRDEMASGRPGLSAPANDKTSTSSGKPVGVDEPPVLWPEEGGASKIPEVPKPEASPDLPSPDSESDANLETPVEEGGKDASDKNGENGPTGTQNPDGLKPDTRTPSSDLGMRVPPFLRNPQPPPIAPPQAVPGDSGNTQNRRISPDANLFAGIVNNFAFRLMESLNLESNFVVSPLSIFIALAMCYLGSDGNTKAQLEQVLGMNDISVHGEHLHQGIKDLMSMVLPQSSEYELLVANGMFLGKDFQPDAPFVEAIQQYYASEIKSLNFGDSQASLKVINDWVAKNTRDVIPKLVNSPLPASTSMLLLNAVYFKGTWKMQFAKNMTFNGRFQTLDGKSRKVPMMNLHEVEFPTYRSWEFNHSFIKLPYEGDQVSMVIALPYSIEMKPMPNITDQQLCHILDSMRKRELDSVVVPKFRLEHSRSLKRPLKQLGISDLFEQGSADLSRLRKQNDLYVSGVLHKALVEVSEEGTVAAASTAIRIIPYSLRDVPEFIANRPFAFYLVHEPSGLVLFHGKVFDFEDGNGSEAAAQGGSRNENIRVRPRPNTKGSSNGNRQRVRLHGAVNYESTK